MSTIKEKGCVSMKIQAVLIDGFKNLSNVKISFDNITALVALNNFGKSNMLSGIDFGLLPPHMFFLQNAGLLPAQ